MDFSPVLLWSRFSGQRHGLLQVYHQAGLTATCWSCSPVRSWRSCLALRTLNAPLCVLFLTCPLRPLHVFSFGLLTLTTRSRRSKGPFRVLSAMLWVCLHLLRRLRSSGVQRTLLWVFYNTLVASALLYAVVCRGGSSMDRDWKRLKKLVRRASSVLDCPLDSLEVLGERRMLAKLMSIMDNTSHLPH